MVRTTRASAKSLIVTVIGCVRKMGNYTLPAGSSLADAIRAAGGFASRPYPPSGVITIRERRARGTGFRRTRIHTGTTNPDEIALRGSETIIIQYDA
ncbi:MAG: SLBB domain-containing protein [Planctomycetes bacterium]|nr:SLBB domain-containing protein [Planctomycetota bacterium]